MAAAPHPHRAVVGPGALPRDRLAFGVATASYQIEGGVDEDGRGPSIWDTFTRQPGTVRDGDDGSRACDSYHRLDDDLALIAGLGVEWYRFSVAWPRVQPDGRGAVSDAGLDYYDRLVDGLLEIGVSPSATLYHWDLPQALEDRGGWLDRGTAEAFVGYASAVHDRLGDRVALWASHNEPWCAAYLGYAAGVHAPGRREGGSAHRAAHHLLLSHAWASEALGDAGLGIVLNVAPVRPEPGAEVVADQVDAIRNRLWWGPLVDGRYDDGVLAVAPELADPELVRDGDLAAMHGSAAWLGINYYTPIRPSRPGAGAPVHPEQDAYPGADPFELVVPEPRTDIGWEIDATGMDELLVRVHEATHLPLLVTENGGAFADDTRDASGVVDDQDRIDYLRDHVAAVDRAREAGADVRGYFVWTLMDNFEWAEGYTKKFGLVHVDRAQPDLPRTPKASYAWVRREVAARADHRG